LGQFLAKPFADAAKVDVTFVALTEVGGTLQPASTTLRGEDWMDGYVDM